MKIRTTGIANLSEDKKPADPWERLGFAIVLTAVREVHDTDKLKALDAALWLLGDGTELAGFLGMEADPAEWLTKGAKME